MDTSLNPITNLDPVTNKTAQDYLETFPLIKDLDDLGDKDKKEVLKKWKPFSYIVKLTTKSQHEAIKTHYFFEKFF